MIEFRDDGRIVITFDGYPVTLRPPKIREFEELLGFADTLDEELEAFNDVRDRLRAPRRVIDGETVIDSEKFGREADDPTPTEVSEYMQARRGVSARFVQKSINLLGDRKGPEDLDDYPAFVQDMALPARFQTHWQTAPLVSSAPPTPPR